MRIGAVTLLCAELARVDDQNSIVGETPTGQRTQPLKHVARKRRRAKPQLHGRRNLIDVLPTGTGSADELQLDVALVDRHARRDL